MKTPTLATSKDGARLLVQCVWIKDRFQHSLFFEDEVGERTLLLSSIEGTDVDDWPPSPPLQEIMESESKDGACLLGVGMAGKSHWSVAIEASRNEPKMTWDTACRVTQSVGSLSSSYRIEQEYRSLENAIRILCGKVQIDIERTDNGIMSLDAQQKTACVRPQIVAENTPATIRWRYHASLKLG